MSVIINLTYFENVDDNEMKHMIQSIIFKHRQMTVVMLCPACLCLQQSLNYEYLFKLMVKLQRQKHKLK